VTLIARSAAWVAAATAPTPSEARRAAKEIVSRPEFQPPAKTLYQQAMDKVGSWLGNLVDAVVGGGRGSVIAWLVVVAAIVAVVYLVVRGVQSGRGLGPDPLAPSVDVERRRPAAEWEAAAAAAEAAGNWREGLRCRYRALVARLARRGVVEEVPGRTAGEYRATVRATLPSSASAFGEATDLFEGAWYGGRSTGPAESEAFRGLAERVVAE
jgi:hypothetical protein